LGARGGLGELADTLALQDAVSEALAALSISDRELVWARAVEGRSFRDLGAERRVTGEWICRRYNAAVQELRPLLAAAGLGVE
jgi:DNA-directed RNA polymerase specialized sigma24 family protein